MCGYNCLLVRRALASVRRALTSSSGGKQATHQVSAREEKTKRAPEETPLRKRAVTSYAREPGAAAATSVLGASWRLQRGGPLERSGRWNSGARLACTRDTEKCNSGKKKQRRAETGRTCSLAAHTRRPRASLFSLSLSPSRLSLGDMRFFVSAVVRPLFPPEARTPSRCPSLMQINLFFCTWPMRCFFAAAAVTALPLESEPPLREPARSESRSLSLWSLIVLFASSLSLAASVAQAHEKRLAIERREPSKQYRTAPALRATQRRRMPDEITLTFRENVERGHIVCLCT